MQYSGIPFKGGAQGLIRKYDNYDRDAKGHRYYRVYQLYDEYPANQFPILCEHTCALFLGGIVGIRQNGERVPFEFKSISIPMEGTKAVHTYPHLISGAGIHRKRPATELLNPSGKGYEYLEYWLAGTLSQPVVIEASNTGREWVLVDILTPEEMIGGCGRGVMPKPLVRDSIYAKKEQAAQFNPATAKFWRVVCESTLQDVFADKYLITFQSLDLEGGGNYSFRDDGTLTTPHHEAGDINLWSNQLIANTAQNSYPTGLAVDFYNATPVIPTQLVVTSDDDTYAPRAFRVMYSNDGVRYQTYTVAVRYQNSTSITTVVDWTFAL